MERFQHVTGCVRRGSAGQVKWGFKWDFFLDSFENKEEKVQQRHNSETGSREWAKVKTPTQRTDERESLRYRADRIHGGAYKRFPCLIWDVKKRSELMLTVAGNKCCLLFYWTRCVFVLLCQMI